MKYIKKKSISRRTVLKGLGASFSLPLLESMIPSSAYAQANSKPVVINCFFANGYPSYRNRNAKIGTGADGSSKYACEPRYLINDYLSFLNPVAKSMSSIVPNTISSHLYFKSGWRQHGNSVGLYSGRINTSRYSDPGSFKAGGAVARDLMLETYDQRIAKALGLKSINAVARASSWNQLNRETLNLLSWRENSSGIIEPVKSYYDPLELYNVITGSLNQSSDKTERVNLLRSRRSLLDSLLPSISKLKQQVSNNDSSLLDRYFSGIRGIEKSISDELNSIENGGTSSLACSGLNIGAIPSANNYDDVIRRIKLIQSIITKAIECDLYQVFGLTHFGIADFLPAFGSDTHTLSHWFFANGGDSAFSGNVEAQQDAKRENYYRSSVGQLRVFSEWMNQLADLKEGNGKPLLERVIANISTDHGEEHAEMGMPVFLCGRGGGGIPAHNGAVFRAANNSCTYIQHHAGQGNPGTAGNRAIETADIWLSIMNGVGVPTTSFGARNRGIIPGFLG